MSLSHKIVAACADDSTPLATILRKCVIFATKLRSDELQRWALSELEGYDPDVEVPEYRTLNITAKGMFIGLTGQLNDQPLPPIVLKKEHKHFATVAHARQGVAALASLVGNGSSGSVQAPWPQDLVVFYQTKFYPQFALNRAWQEIPVSAIVDILDTVRTRVLKFMLELESELGDLETIVADRKAEEVAPVVHNVFNTMVLGGTAMVGSKTADVDARTQTVVAQGDFAALAKALQARGVSKQEVTELQSAIDADAGSTERGKKAQVAGWITKAAKKIGAAASGVAVDAAKATLTSLISSYLGPGAQ